ncbi:MAG: wax ester/triacylglycerol synthase family O-acyltransferase [Microthrixaceae bacterium]
MQRITGADASFLYMENRIVHMHVTGMIMLDPSSMPDGYSFEAFREHVVSRLHRIPVFRQRLLWTPFDIDHPTWADDPEFNIDNHLHREVLKGKKATLRGLKDWVGAFASEPLDRDRPLWKMVVIEGLDSGSIAVVSKVHHVAVDGTTGTDIMAQIVDLAPTAEQEEIPPYQPGRLPSRVELAYRGVASRALDPLRAVRAFGRTAGSISRIVRGATGEDDSKASMARPFDAPRTFFNHSLTPKRSVAFEAARLDDLKYTKATFGVTVNDVFLAACTQALRGYLADHGEFLTRPLVVSVPVSVKGQTSTDSANQVSNMFVRLPVHVDDPVKQLRLVHADTRDAKVVHGAIAADIIGDVTEVTPPAIFNLASRMYSRIGLADRLTPIHNLVISNVPGPPFPLYVAGARLQAVYPFGPLIEGSGLNITVLSNMGNMDIGVIACPDVAPDIDDLAMGIVEAISVLRDAAEAAGGPDVGDKK